MGWKQTKRRTHTGKRDSVVVPNTSNTKYFRKRKKKKKEYKKGPRFVCMFEDLKREGQ